MLANQSLPDRHQNIFQRLPAAGRHLLGFISQAATLFSMFVMVWYRFWPIDVPGLDVSSVPFSYILPAIRLGELAAVVAVTAYALSGWPNFEHLKRGAPKVFALALSGLWLLSLLSASWSLNSILALVQAGHLAIWSLFALMLACAEWPLSRVITFFLAGLLFQSAIGIIQFVAQRFVGLTPDLGELPIKPEYTWVSVVFDGPRRLMRTYALSGHPNILGGHAAIGALLNFGLVIVWPRIWRALAVLMWMSIWILLLITFSRSAWLSTAIGGAAALGLMLRARLLDRRAATAVITLSVIGLILAVVFVILFKPFLIGRIDTTAQPLEEFSIEQRGVMLDAARQLILARPFTGVGAANYISAASALVGYPLDWVHNVPVLVLSELGVFGLAFFLALLGSLTALGIQRWRQRSITLWQSLIAGALVGLLPGLLVDHYLWTDPPGALLFATLAGLWLRRDAQPVKNVDN